MGKLFHLYILTCGTKGASVLRSIRECKENRIKCNLSASRQYPAWQFWGGWGELDPRTIENVYYSTGYDKSIRKRIGYKLTNYLF